MKPAELGPLLVLWDGDCGFCQGSLEWVKKQNPEGEIRYLSFHSDEAATWRKKLGAAALEKAMHIVDADGRIHPGADGFRLLLARIPRYRWLALLMGIPLLRPLCRLGYALIAANRTRLGKHSCNLQRPGSGPSGKPGI